MNLFRTKFFGVLIAVILTVLFFAGCSAKKTCSADSQCKEGSYCSDDKCSEFKTDDYKLVFEKPVDGAVITSADDLDRSVEGIQTDVSITLEEAKTYIHDGMNIVLDVKSGKDIVSFNGKLIKNKAVFSQITVPEGDVILETYLSQNPSLKVEISLKAVKMDVTMFYLKGGAEGVKTALEGTTITDPDDSDGSLENGISLDFIAETTGIEEGAVVKIIFPQIDENKEYSGTVGKEGEVLFKDVPSPILENVIMTVVSGSYSKTVSFKVDSKTFCGFLINLEKDQIFGIADDKNENLSGFQYDLIVSEITGCGKGSKLSIYIDSDEGSEPAQSFTIAADYIEERITLLKSASASDKRKVTVVIEDETKNMKGSKSVSGIIVDMDAPSLDITFPEVGQVINMTDDIDAEEVGLQIKFTGEADDNVTPPVFVTLKIGSTIIIENKEVDGTFEVPHSFSQSSPTSIFNVVVSDSAGNSSDINIPFSVSIDSKLEFFSVCGKEETFIVDGMWINAGDDSDENIEQVQCKVILKVAEGAGITDVSLKSGEGAEVKKTIGEDNTAEFDLSLPESNAGISLNAKAFFGETMADQNNLTIRVDTIPPVALLTNDLLLNNGEKTPSVDITFNYECSELICYYNWDLDSSSPGTYSADDSKTVTGLADGVHSFKIRARDAAGNAGEQVSFNWTVDSAKPETTITSDPGAGSSSNFALFAFISSKTPATFYCRLEKNGANFLPADGSWEACNAGSRNYYGLSEGNYRFQVYAEDELGNADPSPAQHEWILGSAAPVTTITKITPSLSPVNSANIEFEYEATVESTYECRLEKGGAIIENWSNCSSKIKSYSTLVDGNYIFKVRATALYGVVESTPATYSWIIDTVSPKIRLISKPALESPYDSGNFSFECVDVTPCVFECKLDDLVVPCLTGTYSYSSLSGGNHRFTVKATDGAGNKSVDISNTEDEFVNDYTWKIDDTVLGVQITAKPPVSTISDSAAFEFGSNKAATFECKLDSGDFESCTSPKNYSGLAQGNHLFTVKAKFGVTEEAEESYSWDIDSTNPVVTIDLGPDNPTFQTNAIFNFSADETATFECKFSTDSEWQPCTSPKLFPAGTFGTIGQEKSYTFEVKGTDSAGNQGTASHTWVVDLNGPAIEWVSPAPGTDGKVVVGKAQDVYSADPGIYAISVVLKVSGSNPGKPINITGFKTPPGYSVINVSTTSPKNYTLTVGLQDGARVNNPLTITVEDNTGSLATLNQLVIVNTEMPTITWAFPSNNYAFLSNTTAPQFIFNVWNASAGMDVELVNSDTNEVIAIKKTAGSSSVSQEYVTFNPELSDRCASYKLHARLYDAFDGVTHYTNSVTDDLLKSSRSVIVDRTKAVIGEVTIPGIDETDKVLNRDDNLNSDTEGGMKIDVTVNISDPANIIDSNRMVRLFTNNGIGSDASVLLATLHNQGNTAVFEQISLNDCAHTLRVEVTDCSGNVVSKIIETFTVDTVIPELTLSSPKGSSSNWKWIVAADDPALGTVNGDGDFTNVQLVINSSEIIGSFVEVIHTAYNYSGIQLFQNPITSSAVLGTDSVTVALPDLEYAKHKFTVTVEDAFGNTSTIDEIFEVDVIVPDIEFANITDGKEISNDEDPLINGFQMILQMNLGDVAPKSSYVIKAVPVLSEGGGADSSRFEKSWGGSVLTDGTVAKSLTLGGGWWRISSTIIDDHFNGSATGEYDVKIDSDVSSIAIRKSYGYNVGEGPVIDGYSELSPAWMLSEDLNCTGNSCSTALEVWTDAPAGASAYISINGGAEVSKTTIASSGMSYADFSVVLDSSLEHNAVKVRVVSDESNEETYYIDIDEELPGLSLLNPADCSTEDVCGRLDLTDNPVTTDYVELVELGYGYNDDAVSGGVLNFKSSGSIIFEVGGATAGMVTVESISGGAVLGITNGETPILYDDIKDIYYADFSNMKVVDDNPLGQKDYDVVFKITESPSGAVLKYLVKLHIDLFRPDAINIAGTLTVDKKTAEVSVDWVAVEGNNSVFGEIPGAMHEYDIRYQDYNTGVCTIEEAFAGAKKPLETIAGTVPDPIVGDMTYNFFINRISNGQTGINLKESDTHRNGNKYCFAVRAVDAVYASDGTVLAKNIGTISPNDIGEVKMAWTEIDPVSPGFHAFNLKNLGDLDGDGIDDFVIANYFKSIDGSEDRYGKIKIYYSKGENSFEIYGEKDDRLGTGISSKSDFNGDSKTDFAYVDRYGRVNIHTAASNGIINLLPSYSFTADDNSIQNFRTMATGDYDGDGCDDLIISTPEIGLNEIINCGVIYVYLSKCLIENIDGASPDVVFNGNANNTFMGVSGISSVGDLNNDGKTDFFFGNYSNGHIIYGGETGGSISNYNITGLETNSYPGRRSGFGDFNSDGISDLIIGNQSEIRIYYGKISGVSNTPSAIISDISPINYSYPPAVSKFSMSISPEMPDINGDGTSDLITASSRGLLIYYSIDDYISNMTSIFDPFISSTSSNIKILMTSNGILYCNNAKSYGDCHFINYGE